MKEEIKKIHFSESKLNGLLATCIGKSLYEVKKTFTKQVNTVDAVTCCCTCYIGSTGSPCKHQFHQKSFRFHYSF